MNTSGMPPAERGLLGWMCVYGRALAGRPRDPVQNNGATVECSAAGNILSQTQKAFLGSEEERFCGRGSLCKPPFVSPSKATRSASCSRGADGAYTDACYRHSADSFHFTPQQN